MLSNLFTGLSSWFSRFGKSAPRYTKKRIQHGRVEVYDAHEAGWVLASTLPLEQLRACKSLQIENEVSRDPMSHPGSTTQGITTYPVNHRDRGNTGSTTNSDLSGQQSAGNHSATLSGGGDCGGGGVGGGDCGGF